MRFLLEKLGQTGFTVYMLLCWWGFFVNLGFKWLVGALFLLPLSALYPFVALWKLGVFPLGLFVLGVTSFAMIASLHQDKKQEHYG